MGGWAFPAPGATPHAGIAPGRLGFPLHCELSRPASGGGSSAHVASLTDSAASCQSPGNGSWGEAHGQKGFGSQPPNPATCALPTVRSRYSPHQDADPLKPREPAIIRHFTAYKNQDHGAWLRGGDVWLDSCR